jgi:hypothetical protein
MRESIAWAALVVGPWAALVVGPWAALVVGPWAASVGLVTHFLYQFISASPPAPAAAMTDQASRPSYVQAFLQVALARHPQPFHNLRLRRAWIIAQEVQNVVKSAFLMSASVAHRRSPFLKIVADPPDPNRTSLGVFNIMISIAHLPPAFNQFNLILTMLWYN